MARPSVFTPEIEDGILRDIEAGKTGKEAALNNNIKPSALSTRLSRARNEKTKPKPKPAEAEFALKFDQAIIAATEVWEKRFKRGDTETRIQYDAQGNEKGRTKTKKKNASDAWKWLQRRAPEKYGDIAYDTEAFLTMFEDKHGPRWTGIIRKVIAAAEAFHKK